MDPRTHQDRIATVIARDEIRDLAARYAYAVDHRDLDLLVSLFVPDVRVGRDANGRPALREFFADSLARIGPSILHVGTHLIDVESDDRARGIVYCLARIADEAGWIEQAIRYTDTYAQHDGRWLFVRRRHDLWYGVELGTNPLDQPPAEWPARQVGRGTVPEDTETWQRFWADRG